MTQISALFDTHEEAQRAVSELRDLGIADRDLSVIARHGNTTTTRSGDGDITDQDHTNVIRGILGGGALGAGLGVAALAIPGVGPLVAAGAIAASAVPGAMGIGAAVGALGGTMNEVMTKHGIDEEDAAYYGDRLKTGGVVVTLDAANADAERVREVLHRNGGRNAASARAAAV